MKPSSVKVPSKPESIFPKLHAIPFLAQLVRNHSWAHRFAPHEILSFVEIANLAPAGIFRDPLDTLDF
ncbi:uncharacterized protein METZ01_LOCUS187914 [marine metagenome]|uniref:Uncharacterized protein n=1 Tax=marine metagenome TaxID=408172 RepID=A0A382D9E9_9ZZZZ